MFGNSFGKILKLTTFGESHGNFIGGILEGVPPDILLDIDFIQNALNSRNPGKNLTSQRKESDILEILSGIFEGRTTGQSIGFIIKNEDNKSEDYDYLKNIYRPSHADFTYEKKYGIRDFRGGGRASGRETACRVVGGAIAKQIIKNIKINAFISSVGDIMLKKNYTDLNLSDINTSPVNCPDLDISKKIEEKINSIKNNGDSIGGIVTCVIQKVPIGLGDPVFNKLEANLAKAMLSIPASKGFEIGSGFSSSKMLGSEHNDYFNEQQKTDTNYSGGIQGGISNGMDIYFNVAFKPTSTIFKPQKTIDKNNNEIIFNNKGRHDPCIAIRATPVVESMAALVLADHFLLNNIQKNM